jgi:hypothetical protein
MAKISKIIQEEMSTSKIKKIVLECPWAYLSLENNINDTISDTPTKKKYHPPEKKEKPKKIN